MKRVSKATLVIRPGEGFVERRPGLKRAAAELARAYAFNKLVTDEWLEKIGDALWAGLSEENPDLQTELTTVRRKAGTRILPVVIESEDAAVQRLPWELLKHPEFGFLGREEGFTLWRRIPAEPMEEDEPEKGPLRVVMFTALPDDGDWFTELGDDAGAGTARLKVEEQQALALEALGEAIADGTVLLRMPDDGRFSTFETLIKEFQPHVVFIFMHGKFYDEPYQKEAPYAVLQFEAEDGSSEEVRGERFAKAFYGSAVQAVVLAACESGMASSEALTSGLAWRLNEMGIPQVVGMQKGTGTLPHWITRSTTPPTKTTTAT